MVVLPLQAPSQVSSAVQRSCKNCGSRFEITNYRRQHHKKFCSPKCRESSWKAAHPGAMVAYNTVYRRKLGAQPQKYGIDLELRALRTKRYEEKYPDRAKQHRAIQNAVRRGMVDRYTIADWLVRLEEFFGRCAYCWAPATERDHLVPVASGGLNHIDNIVPACKRCNRVKNKSSLLVFLLRRSNEQAQGFNAY